MKKFFREHGLWVLFATAVISVALALMSFFSNTSAPLSNLAGIITSPFRSAYTAVANWFVDKQNYYQDVTALEEENAALKRENAQLQAQLRQAQTDSEENARLPGIGGKSAQRLAFYVLDLPEAEAKEFADAILDAKKSVTCCPVCQNFTAGGLCPICASPKRDGSTICVVADPRDVAAIERAREYNGRYHVLHGVISPMNHVGPDDLAIKSLVERVAQGEVKEVIMATNPDTEGEATAMYIARLLKPFDVKVTRLAYGIPVGGHLEFADDATLMRALEGRREI